jgi:hypothetical protein
MFRSKPRNRRAKYQRLAKSGFRQWLATIGKKQNLTGRKNNRYLL